MQLTFDIPTEDLDIIQDNIEFFEKELAPFKIISDHLTVDDESNADYSGGATMFDWKVVVFEIGSINNLWVMAKWIQNFKITGKFNQ